MIRFEQKSDAPAPKKEAQPKPARTEEAVQLSLDGEEVVEDAPAKGKRKGGFRK